jgi:vitamin B12/bleomycin/antimicrobial peptide transport system ATP-binding/permease protein
MVRETYRLGQKHLICRFWQSASGFWRGSSAWVSWFLIALLMVIVVLQLVVQYSLNFWNRDFFNAFEQKDGTALLAQGLRFLPLAAASTVLAVLSVWGRMTIQRKWREWLSKHLADYWLTNRRYRRLKFISGEHRNPEYRIAEDARVATDAPIDLALGLLTSLLTAITFFGVLWSIGGDLVLRVFGVVLTLHGYLVIAVVAYSTLFTAAMMVVGRNLTYVIEGKNQAEAELRSIAVHLRERGEGTALPNGDPEEHGTLGSVVDHVIAQWRELCRQLMRTTGVGHMNFLFAPMFAWIICTPKYLTGGMPLGEVVQVAAAFVTVQAALNWLVDNYQRLADWVSSVNRVSSLLIALDKIDGEYPLTRRIVGPNFGGRSQPVLDICRPPLDCPNLSRVLPSFGQSPVTCLPRHAAVGECQHDIGTGQLVRMASTQADPRFDGGVAPTVAKDPNFARLSGPLYFLRRPAGVQASREAPSPLVPSPRAGRGSCSTQVR